MKAKYILGVLVVALTFGACKKDLEPQAASESPATPATAQTPATNAPVAQMTPVPAGPNGAVTTTAMPTQPAQVAAGMNPPHGQPGHRCDIAVGAPLNSPPGKTAAKPTMTIDPNQGKNQAFKITPTATPSATPALLQPNAASAQVATAPGMNPPHGQPNHRCDIAVGAPLNSPPGNTAAAAVKADPVKDPSKMEITVSDPAKAEPKKTE